jgi:hypothetical protein
MKAITRIVPVEATTSKTSTSDVRLSLYLVPPVGEITVEELELYAIDRLKGIYPPCQFAEAKYSPIFVCSAEGN